MPDNIPQRHKYETLPGRPAPLGSTVYPDGINFSLFSKTSHSVELWLFENCEDTIPVQIITLDPSKNRTFQYWHVFVKGAKKGICYGYKVFGEFAPEKGRFFDGSKLLIDPFAKALFGRNYIRRDAGRFGIDNTATAIKSIAVGDDCDYDWEGDKPIERPLSHSVIYELHVGGFTSHPNSGVEPRLRGTFKGLIQKIPYLKSLGITAVELMPVFAFDQQDAPPMLENYWGYSPISFFALHWGYGSTEDPLETIREFKDMVKALHRERIEVILDVVYNHTAESGLIGPWLSMKGQDASVYYLFDTKNKFANYTGCGNTVNSNDAVVRRILRASLRYWVDVMHVDGFRFDLASILTRGEKGEVLYNSPVVDAIEMDPFLAGTKLIAEAWDAAGLYQLGFFAGKRLDSRWAEWNGAYRDAIRKFVKSDDGMVPIVASRLIGSPDIYSRPGININQSINFICAHDGFTLNDLASYDNKHNLANLEDNRDGMNDNDSWNSGVEGPTDDKTIEERRVRQIKNFLSILFFTQGTPMIQMGDEVRRTQGGNNNAYCQNNEISWFDWDRVEQHAEVFEFTKKIIAFTQELALFNLDQVLYVGHADDRPHLLWHGVTLNGADWGTESRTLAMEQVYPEAKEHLFIIYNMFWGALDFEIPQAKFGSWRMLVDTKKPTRANFKEQKLANQKTYKVARRTVVILVDE